MPYFRNWETYNHEELLDKYKSVDDYMFEHLDNLGHTEINFSNRSFDYNTDVTALPDAVYKVFEASVKNLHYDFRVNDHHIWQYHKNNGLTKITIKAKRLDTQILRVIEGQLEAVSIINSAYIKQNYNTTIVSGINYFPFKFDLQALLSRIMNIAVVLVVPVCLCMGFPTFLLQIVSEKEKRLLEIMKINGMQMENFWIVTYVFNYLFYLLTISIFYFFGTYVFKFQMFVQSSFLLMFLILNGWGMA